MDAMVKKIFLQICINHGSMKLSDVKTTLNAICSSYDQCAPESDESIKTFVKILHAEISEYGQALTFYLHPIAGEEYLVFSIEDGNNISIEYGDLKQEDRLYFSKLIEHIVQQSDFSIDNMEIFNVFDEIPASQSLGRTKLSKFHIQNLLQTWIKQGYYFKNEKRLYFGPRMIVEFESSLKATYPDKFKDCPLCQKIALWDVNCSSCNIKIHRQCIRKYLARKSDCPVCHKIWSTRLSTD